MKESDFIRQNNRKWQELESSIETKEKNPQKISRLFVQITDDLSYARTFYKNRSVREYLNGLAQILFDDINGKERFSLKKFGRFFSHTVPLAMYSGRKGLRISLILFMICLLIGVFTSIKDPGYAREFLGNSYIDMTEQNIEAGKPMDVYAGSNETEMFLGIAYNNIRVSFLTFFMGVFASIGSIFIMVYNGVMVGVFQYFFIERGLFWESFLSIWTHGTLEISAIIVAGGAGIILGSGLLFPGTYSRLEAFKQSGRKGLIIMAGISPIILAAAFIEGFLTRHTDINEYLRFGFIVICFLFVLFYFVWYPRFLAKRTPDYHKLFENKPMEGPKALFSLTSILNLNQLYSETMGLILRNFSKTVGFTALTALIFTIIIVLAPVGLFVDNVYSVFEYKFSFFSLFNYTSVPWLSVLLITITTLTVLRINVLAKLKLTDNTQVDMKTISNIILGAGLSIALSTFLIATKVDALKLAGFAVLPLLLLIVSISIFQSVSLLSAIRLAPIHLRNNWMKFILTSLLLFASVGALMGIVDLGIGYFIKESLILSITDSLRTQTIIEFSMTVFISIFCFQLLLVLLTIAMGHLYYTLKETNTADNLFDRIRKIEVA